MISRALRIASVSTAAVLAVLAAVLSGCGEESSVEPSTASKSCLIQYLALSQCTAQPGDTITVTARVVRPDDPQQGISGALVEFGESGHIAHGHFVADAVLTDSYGL
ncbi:MAG: hypothetical protein DRN14_07370, partial [Thermoplasmata archaeon]